MFRGPETEAVVMFGDDDNVSGASGFDGAHPLFRVESGGIEGGGWSGAVAPLAVEEGVGAEVEDDAEFEILPLRLLGRGFDVGEILGAGR